MRSIGLSIGRQDTPKSMLRPTGNACAKADKYEPIRDEYLSYWGQDEFSSGLEFNLGSTPIFPRWQEWPLSIQQDADLYACLLEQGMSVSHALAAGRRSWIQVVRGDIRVNGNPISSGDAAAVEAEDSLEITAGENAEFLLFDLE